MRALVLFLLAAAAASAQAPATLHATLDLRAAIAEGWLDDGELVGLRGAVAPLSWGRTLRAADPDGDGRYRVDVPFASVPEGGLRVELKIKVDDRDGDAPNDGWQRGENHVVHMTPGVGGQLTLRWQAQPPTPPALITGRIDTLVGLASDEIAARDVLVWLPPGYHDTDARYPVLYLHDGDTMFGTSPGGEWGMDEAASALVEAGEIEPLLIVAVPNSERRTDEYTPTARGWERTLPRTGPPAADGHGGITGVYAAGPSDSLVVAVRDGALAIDPPDEVAWVAMTATPEGDFALSGTDVRLTFPRAADGAVRSVVARRPAAGGLGDAYGRYLVEVVKPQVDALFRTRPDAASTGLGGSSLGGLITMHLGATRPDVFGRLLVASPSVWWDDRVVLRTVADATPAPGQRVWVDVGTEEGDSMVPDARALADLLVETGWDPALVRYVEAEGAGHDTAAWAARAEDMLRFLFPAE